MNRWRAAGALAPTTCKYDTGGRLVCISSAASVPCGEADTTRTLFSLDALGRHATRTVGAGSPETYRYVGTSETVYEISAGSATITSLIDAAGTRLASATATGTGWAMGDLHGNFAGDLNTSREIVDAIRYDPYGETACVFTGTGSVNPPWRYQGRLDVSPGSADPQNGDALYDGGARFYAPSAGVFTSLDSVAGNAVNPRSMNRFLYAHANPTSLIDPTGHDAVDDERSGCEHDWIPESYCRAHGYPGGSTTSTGSGGTQESGGSSGSSSGATAPDDIITISAPCLGVEVMGVSLTCTVSINVDLNDKPYMPTLSELLEYMASVNYDPGAIGVYLDKVGPYAVALLKAHQDDGTVWLNQGIYRIAELYLLSKGILLDPSEYLEPNRAWAEWSPQVTWGIVGYSPEAWANIQDLASQLKEIQNKITEGRETAALGGGLGGLTGCAKFGSPQGIAACGGVEATAFVFGQTFWYATNQTLVNSEMDKYMELVNAMDTTGDMGWTCNWSYCVPRDWATTGSGQWKTGRGYQYKPSVR
jgi:RHS repeat-associated protein